MWQANKVTFVAQAELCTKYYFSFSSTYWLIQSFSEHRSLKLYYRSYDRRSERALTRDERKQDRNQFQGYERERERTQKRTSASEKIWYIFSKISEKIPQELLVFQ